MLRRAKELFSRGLFDDIPMLHHRNAVGHWLTTARSCEIKSIDRLWVRRSLLSNARICACTVTSSAVVGSSAINRARAIHDRHRNQDALPLASEN